MLKGVNYIILHVPDVDSVLPFYTEKLGFAIEDRLPGFVQFKRPEENGATLALSQEAGHEPTRTIELWWFVDNADSVFADLAARDVEIASPPTDEPFGRAFSIKDPAGHTLYVLQPGQPQA